MKSKLISLPGMCLLMSACGLFDSGVMWKGGPYVLGWIDESENVTVSYDLGGGHSVGRIEMCVFAVGWDGKYLVAKQHPNCNKKLTNFFVIEAQKDNPYASPEKVVIGPMTESEFISKRLELHLPPFSKELESLK